MRPDCRKFYPSALKLFLLALLGLIVGLPLLQPKMVCGADFPGHVAAVVEYDRLLNQGIWYSRWAPDLYFGYGYPALTLYPPLPHRLALAIHRLGLSLRDAVSATMLLSFLMAGPAMFLLARSIYGERAGMVAGLAYTFAPYLADNGLQRFALNEGLAMSLMPLTLWAFGRLKPGTSRGAWRGIAVAALTYAILILTHHVMALFMVPVLIGYLLVMGWTGERSRALIGRAALAGALAMGLSAFYWVVFIAESGWFQLWRAAILDINGWLLYPMHLVSLRDMLWPQQLWPNYELGNPLVQRLLSTPQVVLAVIGLVWVRRLPSRPMRAAVFLFVLVLIATGFMVTPASRWLWDHTQPLQQFQFPWRFLAPASFALALLAGAGAACLDARFRLFNSKTAIAFDAVAVLLFSAWTLPWVRPPTCTIDANPGASYLVWVDRNHIGAGLGDWFLLKWVDEPPSESPLEADLMAGKPLDRLDRSSLPEGAQARLLSPQSIDSVWEIRSTHAFTAHLNSYYFPGWSLTVDGMPVPLVPVPSTGLTVAPVPAGQHIVRLHLDSTPDQRLGDLVSLVSLVGLLVLFVVPNHQGRIPNPGSNPLVPASGVPGWEWAALAGIGVITFGVRIALAGVAPAGPALPSTITRLSTDLGGQVQLIGYELSSPTLRAGQPLTVTLYWQTQSLLMTSYKSFVHVTDADGNLVAQSDAVPANWSRPTTAWLPGEWVADPHVLNVDVRGPVQVWAGMYDPATSQRLNPPGDNSGRVRLGTFAP